MKYLIGLLCLFSVAQAQFAPTSAKTKFVNGIGIGSKDTSQFTAADTIALTIARDSVMYYRYRGFWRPIATGGNLSAYKLISDTLFNNGYTTRARMKQGLDSLAATKGTVNSVGLTMPSAFNVANSPITTSGTLAVTAAGNATQYIRGDGALATLPTSGEGGGASVSYYLNGSVNQGTIGGVTYYEMNKTPIIGAGTNFSINANGYVASFLTDANDPALLKIPAGNWNFETYFQASSGGGSPTFYIELYKYDGTTFTLIASNSGSPKLINDGTNIEAYFSALAVPQTTLTLTDRLAIRIYVTTAGRTITLHTENGHLCQVITTFTTGLTALNGLTAQVQYFATGTSGTDFNIASATATHTFNLPTASATNRGALSSANWTTFNNKIGAGDTAAMLLPYLRKTDTASMLSPYYRTATANAALATKLNISDTAAMLLGYTRVQRFTDSLTNVQSRIQTKLNINDTATMLSPYARTSNLPSLAPYKLISDTLFVNGYTTRGTTKKVIDSLAAIELNISDTAAMLSNYRRTSTKITNSDLANSTISGVSLGGNLFNLSNGYGISGSAYNGSAAQTWIVDTANISTKANVTALLLGKQNNITLTTTGTSGAATLVGATLNIPNYTPDLSGYVPTSRTITINGTTQDLSANRTFSVGTVTSVSGTGTVSGLTLSGTVTSTGNLTLGGTLSLTAANVNAVGAITNNTSGTAANITATSNSTLTTLSALSLPYSQLTGTPSLSGFVTSVTASSPLASSGGTTPNITIAQSSGSTNGFLSSTDWTTFNGKQNALTNPVTGTGTTNYLPKFTGSTTLGNSAISDNGSLISVGLASVFSSYVDGFGLRATSSSAFGGTGVGVEIGYSGGLGYVQAYNRSTSAYQPMKVDGSTVSLNISGTQKLLLDASGNLGLGVTPTSGYGGLQIVGPTSANILTQLGIDGVRAGVRSSGNTAIVLDNSNTTFTNRMWYLYNEGALGSLIIGRPSLDVLTFSNSGNLGLGVTPSATGGVYRSIQVANGAAFFGQTNSSSVVHVAGNTFFDLNNVARYIASGEAAQRYRGLDGAHEWYNAPSGTAGNPITFTQAMTLGANGNLLVGTTTDNGARLQVSGSGTFTTGVNMATTSGNTGIGTTAPAYKLDVNGTLGVTGAATLNSSLTAGIFNQNTPVLFSTDNTNNSPALTIFKNTTANDQDIFRVQKFVNMVGVITVASINSAGSATFSSLAGTGTRMVTANSSGQLEATQTFTDATYYTPTAANQGNVSTITVGSTYYRRIGNTVDVWGDVIITPTANNTQTSISLTLPITSDVSGYSTLFGVGNSYEASKNTSASINGFTSSRAIINFNSQATSSQIFTYKYSYVIN
jgi:hypothetical protein